MGKSRTTLLLIALLQILLCGSERSMMYAATCQADTLSISSDSLTVLPDSAKSDSLIAASNISKLESLTATADTALLTQASDSLAKAAESALPKQQFLPDPNRALWLSLVFPGAGQIYNRKFWKLPIFYGGFLGCTYALSWNQQMYMDYSQAYLDIMDDDPNTKSYEEMLPPRYNIEGREEQFKKIFKRKKDFYRRNRDLSVFCFVGVYLLSVVDAYVDAHLSEFDITPDLSLRFGPAVINNHASLQKQNSYGLGCSLNF